MAEPIEQWLKQLDAILEQHQFETAEEAEAWLLEQSKNRSIDEFFEECATPLLRLRLLWQRAEQAQDPQSALSMYEEAIAHAESTLAAEIQDARLDPSTWPESPLHPYLCCLFGSAGCWEMLGQLDDAETMYRKVWDADPMDSLGVKEKLFSLCLTDGRLHEARYWLDRLNDEDSTILCYHRALLRFLEAADLAEQAYQETGDMEAARAWEDAEANRLLDLALRRNPYVAAIMAHPRAFALECPQQADLGCPAEAVQVMFASAHLWLSDFLALHWLIGRSHHFPLQEPVHREEWNRLLDELGGEPTDEERIAYLRQLEEMDG
jgi:tetratricopeptide (TPR) repeat protein